MIRIKQTRNELELSLTTNLEVEKQQLNGDEHPNVKNTHSLSQGGQPNSNKNSSNSEDELIKNDSHQNQLRSLKQKYSSGVEKYKLILKSIIDCTDDNRRRSGQNYKNKQFTENNQINHEKSQDSQVTIENESQLFEKEESEWVKQLKDQLCTQMQNLMAIHDSIQSQIDQRIGNQKKRDDLTDGSQNQEQNASGEDDYNNSEYQKGEENTHSQVDPNRDKGLVKIFEANTFVDESEEDELQGYFGKRYSSRSQVNPVSFLGEMREVLQEKQKKPLIQEKIVLDTEEEKRNYEKNRFNMKDVLAEKKIFQSTNQASLLSELKFVMKK